MIKAMACNNKNRFNKIKNDMLDKKKKKKITVISNNFASMDICKKTSK